MARAREVSVPIQRGVVMALPWQQRRWQARWITQWRAQLRHQWR